MIECWRCQDREPFWLNATRGPAAPNPIFLSDFAVNRDKCRQGAGERNRPDVLMAFIGRPALTLFVAFSIQRDVNESSKVPRRFAGRVLVTVRRRYTFTYNVRLTCS